MTHANRASLDLFRTLSVATMLGGALPAAEAGKAPPEWIKVTPKGPATTRDGRSFTFDPAQLAARYTADRVAIPVDLDHSTVLLGARGETPKTVGYSSAVEARDDGTYVRVDWNAAGVATFAAGTHRYVSPTIHHDDAGNVTWLHSVALVSAPALADMPALMAAMGLGGGAPAQLAAVAGALNLPATADEAAILAAIGAMVPKATHDATVALLTASTDKLNALTATTRKADVERLLDEAIRERKIVPAQRASYLAMCATEAGVETFRGLMAATLPMLQPSGLDGISPATLATPGVGAGANPRDLSARAGAYREQQAKAGFTITHAEAVRHVAGG